MKTISSIGNLTFTFYKPQNIDEQDEKGLRVQLYYPYFYWKNLNVKMGSPLSLNRDYKEFCLRLDTNFRVVIDKTYRYYGIGFNILGFGIGFDYNK